jgi:hypothetical protein
MGGDFTVDCGKRALNFYFRSKTPADRPTFRQILAQSPNQ